MATDTRYYWKLTRHIFRYNHNHDLFAGTGGKVGGGIHTVNEGKFFVFCKYHSSRMAYIHQITLEHSYLCRRLPRTDPILHDAYFERGRV